MPTLTASLGLIGNEKSTPVLLRAAQDTEPIVRNEAVKSLGKLLNDTAPQVYQAANNLILRSLNSRRERIALVRQSALRALRLSTNPATVKLIAKTSNRDPDPEARRLATEMLICFAGKEVEDALLKSLSDSNWEVRKCAARILAHSVKRKQIHNVPKVREALSRMERIFPSGTREWRLAAQAYLSL